MAVDTTKLLAASDDGDLDASEILLTYYRHNNLSDALDAVIADVVAVAEDVAAESAGRRACQMLADHALKTGNLALYKQAAEIAITQCEAAFEHTREVDQWQTLASALVTAKVFASTSRA